MDNLNHLRDLLVYDIHDLCSAEDQIIEALPKMMAKANNQQLKQALEQHLQVTKQQRSRLEQVKQLLGDTKQQQSNDSGLGIFAGLFGSGSKCKGMEGIISEGEKVMGVDMSPEVLDAAIIESAQKVEHYEICGYGTAKAYAEELGLIDVAQLLQQTLMEEYDADDKLTSLAVGSVNRKAERNNAYNRTTTGVGNPTTTGSNL